MDFQLDKSQQEIQKAAREFAKGEFDKDLAIENDKQQTLPDGLRQTATELGFIGIHYPEKYNGGDLGVFENTLLAEEFCKNDSSIGMALMLSGFSAECLLRFGADTLKSRWLPLVADGKVLAGAGFTEKETGYDLTGIAAAARQEGDEWIINGSKTEVLNGGTNGFYCVLCRTDAAGEPSKSLSIFLVEADRRGVEIENPRNKLGMRMAATTDLRFNNVRVPGDNLIGKSGHGLRQAYAFYEEAWILGAAMALGTARGAFYRALDYTKKREQFGRPLAKFQVTQHKLADMASRIEQSTAFVYRAASSFDRKKSTLAMAAMAKLTACQTALAVTSEAVQLLGGYGYMKEYEVERFYRDAKALELFCGNTGFLRDTIAGGVVGKIK